MRKVGVGFMAHLLVASLLATLTLLDPKKVNTLSLMYRVSNMYLVGWAPSEFVSSRSSRAKNKKARPEDFMDEEDLQDIKDSRKLVDENEEMDLGIGTSLDSQPDESEYVSTIFVPGSRI
jgi:hypothetical protein